MRVATSTVEGEKEHSSRHILLLITFFFSNSSHYILITFSDSQFGLRM